MKPKRDAKENNPGKQKVLVLGELPPSCGKIDRFVPDGMIFLVEGTRLGQLALECAGRRGVAAVGLCCAEPDDDAYMRGFICTWVGECDYIVILAQERTEYWEFAWGYSKALGKRTLFRTVRRPVRCQEWS